MLDELSEIVSNNSKPIENVIESEEISIILNDFLSNLPVLHRNVFVRRYWHLCSIKKIAENYDISISNVKQILFRTRKKLKTILEKEGIQV